MDIEIRKAELSDVPAIAGILRELGWFDRIMNETPAETQVHIADQLKLCQADESHSVFVAITADAAVVGYVSAHWLPYLIHM